MNTDYTLAELCICAAAETFRGQGEVLASGMGVVPRLAASLAMRSINPDLMMTDSESWMLSAPNPLGGRGVDFQQANETWMGFSRVFNNVWSGRRHALVGPTQIDRFGQSNISALGADHAAPKVMLLGSRGYPGNSISHTNSFFSPAHNTRMFVEGECDFVSSIGYNPRRLPRGHSLDDVRPGPDRYRPVRDGLRRAEPPGPAVQPAPRDHPGTGAGKYRFSGRRFRRNAPLQGADSAATGADRRVGPAQSTDFPDCRQPAGRLIG